MRHGRHNFTSLDLQLDAHRSHRTSPHPGPISPSFGKFPHLPASCTPVVPSAISPSAVGGLFTPRWCRFPSPANQAVQIREESGANKRKIGRRQMQEKKVGRERCRRRGDSLCLTWPAAAIPRKYDVCRRVPGYLVHL